jgi:pre-mRNA-splicing factor ATP-dependent RNA helicase DHX38/PRP16
MALADHVAGRLAALLGLGTPNTLLATRVIGLARSLPSEAAFVAAARAFGKIDEGELRKLREEILAVPEERGESVEEKHEERREEQRPREAIRAGLNVMGAEVSRTCARQTSRTGGCLPARSSAAQSRRTMTEAQARCEALLRAGRQPRRPHRPA